MPPGRLPARLPVDPDLAPEGRRPRRATVVALVFAGGCVGGWARYAVTTAWTGPASAFPWPTFAVNTAGAFVLGVVVVLAVRGPRWLRPLAGTGFCGGLTTFSALVVAVDRLAAHGHPATAVAYAAASTAAGVAAAWAGLSAAGRAVGAR
ncbi:MAG: fluoride exporter [Frankiaceae bacterium]|jgi:CrcB protein|nr:fluoride exporter [Frankiaceae bacterium]